MLCACRTSKNAIDTTTVCFAQSGTISRGICMRLINMVKNEAKRCRKQKKPAARSQSVSLEDSVSCTLMRRKRIVWILENQSVPDMSSQWLGSLNTGNHQLHGTQILAILPANEPGQPMRDSHGQSQEPDDQSRHSVRDRSGSGRRDALRRGRLFTELVFIDTTSMVMAHPARILLGPRPHKAGLPWIVLLGPFPRGNSLPRTPLLLGLDPPGNDLPRTTVLLCLVTLVSPGTSLPLIILLLGLTPLPGEELSWSTSVLLGPVPMRAGLLWMQVQLGLVLPGTSLPQTGLGALPGLPPPGRKLPQARSQVLLGCLLQEFRLPQTFMWVMSPLIRLTTHLGLPPCGQQLLGSRSAVLLGCVPRRSGYRERSDWGRFLGEPDYHKHTCQPPGGTDWSGDPAGPAPDQCIATTDTDTTSAGASVNRTEGNMAAADHVNWTEQRAMASMTQPQDTHLHRQPGQQPGLGRQWVVNQQRGSQIWVKAHSTQPVSHGVSNTAWTRGSYCGVYGTMDPTNYGTYLHWSYWRQSGSDNEISQFISNEQCGVYWQWLYVVPSVSTSATSVWLLQHSRIQ